MPPGPPPPPSCYVLYTPSMSIPNFGVPPPPSQNSKSCMKPCTHIFKHTPTPQIMFMKLCHICNHHAPPPPPPLKIQIPPVAPPPLDNFLNETLIVVDH